MTAEFAQFIASLPMGFLSAEDLDTVIKEDRLQPVLVRAGSCRFTCPAQNVRHLTRCLETGGDYVRDISIPHNDCSQARVILMQQMRAKV